MLLIVVSIIGIAVFCVVCKRETPHDKQKEKGVYQCQECGEESYPYEA